MRIKGSVHLDAGAVRVLQDSGKSLLAVGIHAVSGEFNRGDVVSCVDAQGKEIARGLVNYDHEEVAKLKGQPSEQIEHMLGYAGEEEVIHRDNLILSD